ncbi:host cell division inhibitor Icd-like protein [Providencia rettgeri]|nr:host cell division inhibitor Icd-like protein [Providencia rettgeri]
MNATKAIFDTPNRGNQSSNINQLTPDWVNIAYQVNDSLLAGNNVSSTYTLNNTVALNYGITGNQSAKTLADVSVKIRGEITPFQEFFESIKKSGFVKCAIHHLRLWVIVGYSKNALAKSSVRIGVLNQLLATHDAPSVFFCVHAYAHLLNAVLYRAESMVAAAEQPKGWLDSSNSSNANSTVVTTPEIGVSSGDSLTKLLEIIVMMATPTQTQFKFLFLAVKRTDKTDTPHRIEATAPNEHDARLMLVRDYILSFAGRLPAQEVAHA